MLEESLRERDALLDGLSGQVAARNLEHRIARPHVPRAAIENGEISSAEHDARNLQTRDGIERAAAFCDIERRKQAEDALQKSEGWYRTIFMNSPVGIFRSTFEGRFLEVNPALASMLGYDSPEEVVEKIHDIGEQIYVRAEKRDKIVSEQFLEEGVSHHLNRYRRRDGSEFVANLYLKTVRDEENNPVFFEGIVEDITERKNAEEEIRRSEEKHCSILKTAMDGFIMTDANGRVLEVNEAYCRMSGYGEGELLSMKVEDLVSDEAADEIVRRLKDIATRGHDRFESAHRRKDGGVVYVEVSAMHRKGEEACFVCFVRDISEKKKQERELQLRSLVLDQIHDHVTITDLDGVISYVNQATEKSLCRSRQALVGEKTDIYGEDAERGATQNEILEQTIRNGSWRGEVVNFAADGGELILDCRTKVVYDNQGKPIALSGVATDITDYKRSEEEQRKLRKQLADAMEMARLGHWEYDVRKDLFTFNDQFYKIFRTTARQEGGYAMPSAQYARRFVHPDDRDLVAKEIQKAIEATGTDFSRTLEHRMLYADGKAGFIAVRFFIVKNAHGDTVKSHGVNQDITERKQAEMALRESEEKYRKLVDMAPYGIQLTDTEGKIVFSNPAHHRIQGYADGELVGKYIWDLMADEKHREKAKSYYEKILRERPVPEVYFNRDKSKDGREIDVQVNWDYIYGAKGEIEGIISIISDITDQVKLESRLRQAQRMESIGDLAGGIAHDFNNILFPIIGMSEMLIDDLPPGSPERESLRQIYLAGKRGGDLVKQILAFSRQSEHQMIPTRIQNVLKEVLKLSRSSIPSYIEIRQDIQSDCGMVMADPSQIHQIAMNIVTNAYHAVEETGGKISVGLRQVQLDALEAFDVDLRPGKYAMLSVSDTGHGMSEDIIDKIFDPYFTTKEQGKGTGLGLAVVYGIVKEHKGEIRVRSRIGKGSTFDVYLPLMEKPIGREPASMAQECPGGNERILLVDDEGPIANLEKLVLERLGYKVSSHLNSTEAFEAFMASPFSFDLVITDMSMPSLTGARLAEKILAVRPDVPIIICTGFSERIDEKKARSLGIKGFLMKPVVRADLAAEARRVLDEAKGGSRRDENRCE